MSMYDVAIHEDSALQIHEVLVHFLEESGAGDALLATFDARTTVGMVRLFAKEASVAIGAVLAGARPRPHRIDELAGPLTITPGRPMFRERSA